DLSCVVVEPGHEQALAALGFAPGGGFADGRRAYVRPPQGMAFLARETRRAESEDAALAAVLDPGFAPSETVVLERADASVAPAAHEVELWYRPRGLAPAVALSLAGLVLTAVGGLRCLSRSSWWRSSPRSPSSSSSST